MKHSYLQIRAMRARGYSWREIAAKFGCSLTTVRRALADDLHDIQQGNRERQKRYRERLRNATKNC